MNIKIGKKNIGPNERAFIIAEAGVNHNGSFRIAKKLVDEAVVAGVDAIKFQTFSADRLVTIDAPKADYQKKNTHNSASQYSMLKKLELSEKNQTALKKYCDSKKIIFLSTPHSGIEDVDFLSNLNVEAFKISSADLTNIPLIEYAAKKRKPIILSTGMSSFEEISKAVNAIRKRGNKQIILLQCTTSYPCPPEDVNLLAMKTMEKKFKLHIGFSDHTTGLLAAQLAVAMGAKVIEKHFTLDKNMPGPDHCASINPKQLSEFVLGIRLVEKILGSEKKTVLQSEKSNLKTIRKGIYVAQSILKGTKITRKMLCIKRPFAGLLPEKIVSIIGKKAVKNLEKDTPLKKNYVR
ncbi:MAG: N-acetylneuraminate synthase [archaeon]|nr:N-acetylneuraminate synthase [archaeon]